MKSTRKQNISPATELVRGLTGTLPSTPARCSGIGRAALLARQVFALVLIVLIVPMGQGALLFAQTAPPQQEQYNGATPPPPPPSAQNGAQDQNAPQDQGDQPDDQGAPPPDQSAPQGQPLSPDELGQMVAPIALYPDALVAQVLAASTYPTQVVEADRWLQAQGNMPAAQLGDAANQQNWDPSVKALIAFPSVLAQMDKNIQWTTDLGNAYYNQPDDVMSAIQTMRSRAQTAGTLRTTPQQVVSDDGGDIAIAPANPDVVYVPAYNPWGVYGGPVVVYPGYYYGPPAGVYFGTGLAIGFGVGIGIGIWSHWGWGWNSWRPDWRHRSIYYGGNRYYSHSRTVYNRGFNRPGSPHGRPGSRGSYYGHNANYNRGNRGGQQFRGNGNQQRRVNQPQNRGNQQFRGNQQNRGNQQYRSNQQNRSNQQFHVNQQQNRGNAAPNSNRNAAQPRPNRTSFKGNTNSRPQSSAGHQGGGRPSGGGGGARPSGGGGGGHAGGGGGHDGGHH